MKSNKNKNKKNGNSKPNYKGGNGKPKTPDTVPTKLGGTNVPDTTNPTTKAGNDVKWYAANSKLLNDAANIAYSNAVGLGYDLSDKEGFRNATLPGIMVINLIPSIGISNAPSSDINIASRMYFTWLRKENSGRVNYESPDLMTYYLAQTSCYAYYTELVRLYGIFNTYSVTNRFIGRAMVQALGYDYDDLALNLAGLRYYINTFATKLNTFAAPRDMYYYDAISNYPLHVLKDSDEDKCSFYLFQYKWYWKWSGTADANGSSLQIASRTKQSGNTLEDITQFGDDLFNAMLFNEDIAIMSGDTLRAYGQDGVRQVKGIEDNYVTLPQYDQTLLSQIHNLTVIPAPVRGEVTQKNGHLQFAPIILESTLPSESIGTGYSLWGTERYLLDSGENIPTPEWNMEASRIMTFIGESTTDDTGETPFAYWPIEQCGAVMCVGLTIYQLDESTAGVTAVYPSSELVTSILYPNTGSSPWLDQDFATKVLLLMVWKTTFDWAPLYYIALPDINGVDNLGDKPMAVYPLGEVFNYTAISRDVLKKMNNVAFLSLFNVGQYSTEI